MADREINPAALEAEQRSCSRCGAKLNFAPGTSTLQCPYCGFASPIADAEALVAELDYHGYLEKAAGEKRSQETLLVKCEKCGAETTVPPEAAADQCPFCGANRVFSRSVSRVLKPEGVLPFQVKRKEAADRLRRWIHGLWFAPGSLKRFAQTGDKLAGVYLPFWTYDSETSTAYAGERGEHYYTTENYVSRVHGRPTTLSRRVRHTRWRPAEGTAAVNFDDILVLAGKSLPQEYIDRLAPWDLTALLPYADDYLSGFRAESYSLSLAEGFEVAKKTMAPAIEAAIRSDIGGDEQRIHSAETRYENISFKHILLPVWASAYRFREKTFRILINARTGEVQGERPFSAWKIAGAALAAIAIIGFLILIGSSQ